MTVNYNVYYLNTVKSFSKIKTDLHYRSSHVVLNITEGERLYFSYHTATHVKLTIHKSKLPTRGILSRFQKVKT